MQSLCCAGLKRLWKKLEFFDYSFSPDESKILIATEEEPIYRRSSTYENYVFDLSTKKVSKVSAAGKQMFASFSPDGNKIAFVRDNNIFINDLKTGTESKITNDGEFNKIKNGWSDWVYEEEFSFSKAFFWNADSRKIAYYKFNETLVKEYSFSDYNDQLYPSEYKYKYPKAGEDNSIVSIHVYDIKQTENKTIDIGNLTDIYIPRIKWTKDANTLSVVRMNRHQSKLELLMADADKGTTHTVYAENADTYIDIHEGDGDYVYFPDEKHFILVKNIKV